MRAMILKLSRDTVAWTGGASHDPVLENYIVSHAKGKYRKTRVSSGVMESLILAQDERWRRA